MPVRCQWELKTRNEEEKIHRPPQRTRGSMSVFTQRAYSCGISERLAEAGPGTDAKASHQHPG